jgi:S1-C subfamily serine protease
MKKISGIIAVVVAIAAVPSGAIAQKSKAAIGAAFIYKDNRVKVAEVLPGGTGDQMGVLAGDVITHAGGRRINNQLKLTAYVNNLEVGGPVELTVNRAGKSLQLKGKAMARQR